MSDTIHQEVSFPATPETVYQALMCSEKHTSFTGAPATISSDVGGEFACHDGVISGRNIELEPGKRIVQAWRAAFWDEGVYSIVRYELTSDGDGGTKLVLDHAGYPEGMGEGLASGWQTRYWEPLEKFLSSN